VYCATCVVIVYTHLFGGLALVAHTIIVARYGQRRWRFVAVAVVVAVAGAPLVWLAAHQAGEIGWVSRPDPASVGSFLFRVCGASALVALVLTVVLVVRRRGGAGRDRGAATGSAALVGWWAVLPPVALVAASFVQPVLVARYALVAVPALVIGVAVLLRRVGGRAAASLAAVAVLVGAAVLVFQQSRPYKYEDFRAAADTVTDSARPGDGLVFLPSSLRVGYDEYPRPDATDPAVPVAADLGLLSPTTWRRDGVIGGQECSPAVLGQRIGGYSRIFLVGATLDAALRDRHSAAERAKEQALGSGYRVVWTARDGDVAVTLLERSPLVGLAPAG
jgi:mannosyltransferase